MSVRIEKSGSVWTAMLLHASHNLFVQAFFDAQTRRTRVTGLWTTEFGSGLALAALVVAIVFYAKRGELSHCAYAEYRKPQKASQTVSALAS